MRGKPGPSWSITVSVPPEQAYEYVADILKHPEWGMDDMTMAATTPGETKVGSRFKAEGTLFGRRNPSTVVVTELEPPRRLEFEAEDRQGISGHVFEFEKQDGGTLITRKMYGVKQPFFGPLLLFFFRGAIDKDYNGALAKLKQKLETGAASTSPSSTQQAES
jgi:uncharacterized protein YndB with AHSA1/START domain